MNYQVPDRRFDACKADEQYQYSMAEAAERLEDALDYLVRRHDETKHLESHAFHSDARDLIPPIMADIVKLMKDLDAAINEVPVLWKDHHNDR